MFHAKLFIFKPKSQRGEKIMIISASRRTDIPCYYSKWFMNRIRAGYVLTRNPMNHAQLSKIPLSPQIVDCIVFWTKDALNMLPHLDELDRLCYTYYFQFTLTPYGHVLEQNLRPKKDILETFISLSRRIGRERVVWRYDPIVLNDELDISYHKAAFHRLAEKLSPFTDTVVISFADMYPKLKDAPLRPIAPDEIVELSGMIGKTAGEYGLRAAVCCEQDDLAKYGIGRSSCIDKERIEKILGCSLNLRKDKNQREGCGCAESIDIGAYNTCMNGCVYCYANNSLPAVRRRWEAHDPEGELLTGSAEKNEKVTERKAESNKQEQRKLF